MDKKHYNELTLLAQEIYDEASDKFTNYCASEEVSTFFLGNALALLEPASQEAEIKKFADDLRRIISFAQKKMGDAPNHS